MSGIRSTFSSKKNLLSRRGVSNIIGGRKNDLRRSSPIVTFRRRRSLKGEVCFGSPHGSRGEEDKETKKTKGKTTKQCPWVGGDAFIFGKKAVVLHVGRTPLD